MIPGHFRTECFELAENTGESACDGVVDFTGQPSPFSSDAGLPSVSLQLSL